MARPRRDQPVPTDDQGLLDQWTGPPARAIRYWPAARALDWWNGRRDGRRGIPWFDADGSPDGPSSPDGLAHDGPGGTDAAGDAAPGVRTAGPVVVAPMTPAEATPPGGELGAVTHSPAEIPVTAPFYVRELDSQARDSAYAEVVRSAGRVRSLKARLAELRVGAAQLLSQLREAQSVLAAVPAVPDEATLQVRRRVEHERGREDSLVRARRRQEHNKARELLLASAGTAAERYRNRLEEIARLEALVLTEEVVRAARVARIREHATRRSQAYWRHNLRRHRHGARLGPHLESAGVDLPPWVVDTAEADALEYGRAPEGGQS